MIPKPFATVEITFDTLHKVPPTADDAAFEAERVRMQAMLVAENSGEHARPER